MGASGRAERVREIAGRYAAVRGPLLPVLHAVQDELGHLERGDVVAVADVLNLSVADVHGVVSFYHDFRTTPRPGHSVALCRAEACQSVGAQELFDSTTSRFAHEPAVEVREVFCLGLCALGPSGMLDGHVHARLTPERVTALTAEWVR